VKAVRYEQFGGPEVLQLVDVPDPSPGPADVVVRVAATTLNRLDVVQRSGWYTLPGYALPHISGMDVAGVVVATGSAVTSVHEGDRVVIDPSMSEVAGDSKLAGRGDLYGELGVIGGTVDGGYAELCLAPASHVHPVPHSMDLLAAAAFPTAWLTAWHALIEMGNLQPGETVMMHGAGSGVSIAALHIAKWRGAVVLATASSDQKCERARALGADAVCNNRTDDVTGFARAFTEGAGVDMVLEHVGPTLFGASLFAIKPRGRLVTCGNTAGDTATIPSLGYVFHSGISIIGSDPYRYREFADAWQVYCELRPPVTVDTEYSLADAAEAHRRMEAGTFFGKLALRP
jgi:NADPH:quinone reductase-like Zn-dependent oxidoreductase